MNITSRWSRPALTCSTAVVLALLAGCGGGGGDGDEPAGLDADTSAPSAPDDTGSSDETPDDSESKPTAEATPTTHEFADAGVTVVEPVASSKSEEAALAAYVEFAHQWRKSLHDAQLSETLPGLAVQPIIDGVKDSLDYQTENGVRYGGEMIINPTVEESRNNVVVLGGCIDGSAVTLIDDGEERAPDGVDEHPVIPMNVVIANDGTGWKVNENTLHEGESC